MNIFAVELKVIATFSSYIAADSKQNAEAELKSRARLLQPDSIVTESVAYQMEKCEYCREEHFGPACKPGQTQRMKPVAELLLRPSWERAQL